MNILSPSNVKSVKSILFEGSVNVPAGFLGLHETGTTAPVLPSRTYPPLFSYGSRRTHDGGTSWYNIETSKGVFNWDRLDSIVEHSAARGLDVMFVVYGTPAWASSGVINDLYGKPGGHYPPTNMQDLYDFVYAVVSRHPTIIKFIEPWNEPVFTGNTSSFFVGTAEQMAQMAKTVYQAAKAAVPSIKVLSPAFDGDVTSKLQAWANASDGSGGTGKDWCEGIAYHPYHTNIPAGVSQYPNVIADSLTTRTAQIRAAVPNKDLYATELGMATSLTDPNIVNKTSRYQAAYVWRVAVQLAFLGWKKCVWYTYNNNLSGNPHSHEETAYAYAKISALSGKTITKVELLSDDSFKVTTI